MDEARAREVLGQMIKEGDRLFDPSDYLDWRPGETDAVIDGRFNADELEAIAWWMRNKG